MRTKGRCWGALGVCLLTVMLATAGCAYRHFFHGVDVSVKPEGEPHMQYTKLVKKLLVTETVVQTKEGAVNLTQAVGDAFGGSRSKRTKNNAPLVNGQAVEENEGLHPHIQWTKTPDFVHV